MKIFTYNCYGRYGYWETGLVQAETKEEAEGKVRESVGHDRFSVDEPEFDETGVLELAAS